MPNWKRNAARATERALLVLLLAGPPAAADALDDLRSTLKRLQGAEPVKAAVEFQFARTTSEDGGPVTLQGTVTARVEDGPQGLRIAWDRATLQQAESEQRLYALDPLIPAPTAQIMRSLTALDLAEHLHQGETLERLLLQASLLETRPDPWQGRPATLLVVQFRPVLNPPSLRRAVNEAKGQARIWLGPDGVPLAWRGDVTYKGSRFMIHFHGTQTAEVRLLRTGTRLVGAWAQYEEHQDGLGQSLVTRRGYRFTF